MTTAVSCKLCYGNGSSPVGSVCLSCGGAGSVHVLEPATACKLCYGNGSSPGGSRCVSCGGCGYAGRIASGKGTGSTVLDPATVALLDELKAIRKATTGTAQQMTEVGSIAYFVGLFISMGMNFALGNGFGALLVSWLSWLNVGYVVVGLATGAYATPHPAS